MNDDELLNKNTEYISNFAKWLEKTTFNKEKGFVISRSSAAIYTHTGAPMVALRIYPLSPYINEKTAKKLVLRLVQAKKTFDRVMLKNSHDI